MWANKSLAQKNKKKKKQSPPNRRPSSLQSFSFDDFDVSADSTTLMSAVILQQIGLNICLANRKKDVVAELWESDFPTAHTDRNAPPAAPTPSPPWNNPCSQQFTSTICKDGVYMCTQTVNFEPSNCDQAQLQSTS